MVNPKKFIELLKKNKINFFSGTPDSVLSNFLELLKKEKNFYISPHEGIAVSSAIGYHYATKKIPMVFMQNSGLGNILNPISSIAHKKIFSIPLILLIGMRGYKGDEPQHLIQIKSTPKILKSSDISYFWLNKNQEINKQIKYALSLTKKNKMPVAILIRKGTFYKKKSVTKKIKNNKNSGSSYNDYIVTLSKYIKKDDYIFSPTGFVHRTLFSNRKNFKTKKIFYNIGGMGHLSSIAYTVANIKKKKRIFCLEGDGSFLMHLGSQALIDKSKIKNFRYILFNNGTHFSTGGNIASNISNINLKLFSKSIGFNYCKIKNFKELESFMKKKSEENFFLDLICSNVHLNNLPRPKLTQIKFFNI